MLALPIFPARLQASIFGRSELNFRVRNGNGWTLALISTNSMLSGLAGEQTVLYCIPSLLSRTFSVLQKAQYKVLFAYFFFQEKVGGDPYGNRTHVCGVRGRRLSRLTNGPFGAPSGTRTNDPAVNSRMLYRLS